MGHERLQSTKGLLTALALLCLAFASPASAASSHPRTPSLDVTGLNHACGDAVDSKGDLYLASAGESKIKVYDPSHVLLTEIVDTSTPCGLAVTTTGNLYVSEQATGEVVRFKPSEYPPTVSTTYGSREVIDSSGKAKGIAVDPIDDRLYVAEDTKVALYSAAGSFEANLGEGTLTEATGVASYTTPAINFVSDHYLWVADAKGAEADRLYLFGGTEVGALKLRRQLNGSTTPDGSFGFGTNGAYLAEDPGNRNSEGKCVPVGEQACTAGHLYLYDAAHGALDEFDASGEYLDQTKDAAFADAKPTAVAIDRSGGANDGTLYVTTGVKALAFGPLKPPSRATLGEPLSHILKGAQAVATDSHGDVYAGAGAAVHIYGPSGAELTSFEDKHQPDDVAIDSTGKVYVLDVGAGFASEAEVTYYTPSAYPPKAGTTYTRHEPLIATYKDFSNIKPNAIATVPAPAPGKDRLLVTTSKTTHLYDSAANGSGLLDSDFAKGLTYTGATSNRQSIAVNGATGTVYFGNNTGSPGTIFGVNEAGTELLAKFQNTSSSNGEVGANPFVAVDQASGHVLEYDNTTQAREYDASGAFVAEFGNFTDSAARGYRIAVDSACALHEPKPLTGKACEEFDPANGTVYVAYDDPNKNHPPYDVTAFGPLDYGPTPPTPEYELKVKPTGTGAGKVTSSPAGIDCGSTCEAKFVEDTEVTLTQSADPGSKFVEWRGACAGSGECKVDMSEAREVTAEFESTETEKFPLKVVIEGPGSGEVTSSPAGIECSSTCEADFFKGAKVTLTAEEGESSKFAGWTGCDAEPSAVKCEVSISAAREVKAKFKVETPLLTVVEEGGGSGTVTSEPAGIDCGATCSAEFTLNEAVTLKAKAEEGSTFGGWEVVGSPGACAGEEPTCLVTMSKAREVKATFEALPKARARQANPVLYGEATLRGEVDPSGEATEYHFEYLTEEEYEEAGGTFEGARSTLAGELAPGKGFVAVKATLVGLEEGTAYRFGLFVENSVGPAEDEGSFITLQRRSPQTCSNGAYRFGLSANLPDCRAYELVTPGQTNGLNPFAPHASFSDWLTAQHGTGAGEDLAYYTNGTLPGFEGNGRLDGYRAERGTGDHPADGWQSSLFSPGYAESAPGTLRSPYPAGVAPDQLFSAWETEPEPETFPETLPKGTYLRTPAGFEALGRGSLGTDLAAKIQYVSAGGAHAIFASKEHLEEGAAPEGTEAIYDRPAGSSSAEVVSIEPDGSAFGSGEGATYLGATEDGAAVAFSVGGTLYLHRGGETIEIANGSNAFAGISEDGKRVFYEKSGGLYVCDTEAGPCAGSGAHAATEIANSGIFTLVSPDGSHVFFSSTEALTEEEVNDNGEEAEEGEHNLYAWDGVETRFIGVLSAGDFKGRAFAAIEGMNLANWTTAIGSGANSGRALVPARSTPSGGAFAFQSHAQLTAYDNEGVGEIYRYDPAAEEGQRLLCVSCDPTGAPPSTDALFEDIRGIDGPPLRGGTTMIANLTDNGNEAFFQSFDRLLPEDANEAEDVYEWTAQGAGDCTRPGGCLALISSGQGETPSYLYAMSADGRDVFIHTQEKLVGTDFAGSPSVYDTRVGGGIPEPTPSAPCQGDACQGNGTEPPAIPNATSTGGGEGNGTPARPPSRCAKGKHRVKGRCVATKKHKHRKHRHQRRAHANRGGNR